MSSWVMETYTQDKIYVEYKWDKYAPHWITFVGEERDDGLVYTLWENRYGTEKQAKASFKRQVRKVKSGEY